MGLKETYVSNLIDLAGNKAQYDEHAKNLFKDKDILAYILKYSVKEFADYTLEEAKAAIEGEPEISTRKVRPNGVHTIENESNIPDEGRMYFDVVLTAFYTKTHNGERQKIYINIEVQKSFYPGYDLVTRGIVYSARLISQQMDVEYTAEDYDGVKKVYSIWICMNTPNKNKSYKQVADSIVEYSAKPNILYPNDGLSDIIATGRYDLMSTIFINLNADRTVDSKNKLIGMLSTLFSDKIPIDRKKEILENEYNIPMTVELEREVSTMCNLSDIAWEQGIEEGLEKGKSIIYDLIQSRLITPEIGAEKLEITVERLKTDMETAGFQFPDK